MDFDVAAIHYDCNESCAFIARVLGPRGLMPTPKAGTVTDDLADSH